MIRPFITRLAAAAIRHRATARRKSATANLGSVCRLESLEVRQVLTPGFGFANTAGAAGKSIAAEQVALDSQNHVLAMGTFDGTVDFDPGPSQSTLTNNVDFKDVFITKSDSSGNLVWARGLSGDAAIKVGGIGADGLGNVYTTGSFQGTVDFNPGAGVFNMTSVGGQGPGSLSAFDVFVTKFDAAGQFVWAKKFSSPGGMAAGNKFGTDVAVSSDGNSVVITGSFATTVDFNPGAGTTLLTSSGLSDAFITKLNTNGDLVWVRKFTPASAQQSAGNSVALDSTGAVYVGGHFTGTTDFNPGVGIANLVSSGQTDGFVAKLASNGNYAWASKVVSSSQYDFTNAIAVSGSVVAATGYFRGTARFTSTTVGGSTTMTSAGGDDVFVIRLSTGTGLALTDAVRLGGTGNDQGTGVAIDGGDAVYTTGYFESTADFDPGAGVAQLSSNGGRDVFVTKLSSTLGFDWAVKAGAGSNDVGWGIRVDSAKSVYIVGEFRNTVDFDPTAGIQNRTAIGSSDAFTWKLTNSSAAQFAAAPSTAMVSSHVSLPADLFEVRLLDDLLSHFDGLSSL